MLLLEKKKKKKALLVSIILCFDITSADTLFYVYIVSEYYILVKSLCNSTNVNGVTLLQLLSPILEHNAMGLIFHYINLNENKDIRLAFDALRVCSSFFFFTFKLSLYH